VIKEEKELNEDKQLSDILKGKDEFFQEDNNALLGKITYTIIDEEDDEKVKQEMNFFLKN
jgi:hypothetical protein